MSECDKKNEIPTKIVAYIHRGDGDERGTQIDLCIDRNDRVVSLCEMKYSLAEYEVDKTYDEKLRDRQEIFRRETKTRKALQNVLVTTYGLKNNKYALRFQAVVTMEDLFKE